MTDSSLGRGPGHIDLTRDARDGDVRTMLLVIYGLYLAGFITGGVTTVVGVILAYLGKGSGPDWAQGHYEFQIRTFWLLLVATFAFAALVVGTTAATFGLAILFWLVVGAPVLLALMIWYAVRVANGFNHALNSRAYPDPAALLI